MRAITADYQERIVIAPEDVIPKSSWFKFVKCSLLVALSMLVILAVISLIVAESFVSNKHKDSLGIGIVSLVGIILFLVGMVAILKEHIPLILTFAVAMVIYLLVFMYSRVITSPGLIILRTFILLLLAVEAFCFCIMIRDWRAIQVSRLNQRLMKEAQLAQYAAANGLIPYGGAHHQVYNQQGYHQAQFQMSPSSAIMSPMYTGPQQHLQQQQQHLHQQQQYQMQQTNQHLPLSQSYSRQQHRTPQMQRARNVTYSDQVNRPQHQLYNQRQVNPYIQVDEDENPYSVIGEPSRVQQTSSAIYTQSRFYVPADRY